MQRPRHLQQAMLLCIPIVAHNMAASCNKGSLVWRLCVTNVLLTGSSSLESLNRFQARSAKQRPRLLQQAMLLCMPMVAHNMAASCNKASLAWRLCALLC